MVAEMLSQEEINALLGSVGSDESESSELEQNRNEKISNK